MKRFASLAVAAALILPFTCSAMTVQQWEARTNLAHDFTEGKLDQKIRDNYTDHEITLSGAVLSVRFDEDGWKGNVKAIRQFSDCFFKNQCKQPNGL